MKKTSTALCGLLSALLILAAGISSTSASLVSYWSFDDAGSPAIDSVSGYNLSGPATFGVSGVAGNAVSIDSSLGQGLSTPYQANLNTLSTSVSFWFKTDATSLSYMVHSQYGPVPFNDLRGWYFYSVGTTVTFVSGAGAGGWESLAVTYPGTVGEWYHVTGTIDDSTGQKKLYVSELGGSFDNTPGVSSAPNYFPNPGTSFDIPLTGLNMAGDIDELRVYDEALNATQVQDLFAAVPEPSHALMLTMSGFAGILRRRRRRN